MSDPLHPAAGARFLLERLADDGPRATYRAAIYTPAACHEATATLADDGTVTLPTTGAPAELDATLATFAKLTARGAPHRRASGLPAWPRRVLRWRP